MGYLPLINLQITMTIKNIFVAAFALLAITAFTVSFNNYKDVGAATFTFGVPRVSTSTLSYVGPGTNLQQVFATSTGCINRKITTQNSAIRLTIDGSIPTGQYGLWQSASTTVDYDNGANGCGAINAYSYASSTLTATGLTDSQ